MAKIPYGGLQYSKELEQDDPWTKLDTIQEHLEDDGSLPPYYARWLGEAIKRSNQSPNEFLKRLGLKGRKAVHDEYGWIIWGERIEDSMKNQGWKREEALTEISVFYKEDRLDGGKAISSTKLREWHDTWLSYHGMPKYESSESEVNQ